MEKRFFKIWAGISLFAIINLIVFDAIILFVPDTLQVQYTPDDAYYYLSLARNFANLHIWTFDSGASLTTGFHPLLAYVLVFFYKFFQPGPNGFIKINLAISIILTISSVAIIFWKAWKYQQPILLASLAILISTRNILINSVSGMEWALTVFIIVLFCSTMAEKSSTRAGKATLFILGFAGSLARMDFGVLAFSFVISSLIIWLKERDNQYLKASLSGLIGAGTGVVLVLLHNFILTKQALQSSALMKSYWMSGTLHWGVLIVSVTGLFILLAISIFLGKASETSTNSLQKLFTLSAFFTWINYSILYLKNSDVHAWYSVSIVFPVFIFLCSLWNAIQHGRLKKYIFMPHAIFAIIFMVSFSTTAIKIYPLGDQKSEWPHQLIFLEAGKYMHLHAVNDGRIGAWNAGIMNYYEGGNIINLDGLVNNDIYPYATTLSSSDYLNKVNIKYVIDYDSMFTKNLLRRSGYNSSQFINTLSPMITFNKVAYPDWGYLTLYKIE